MRDGTSGRPSRQPGHDPFSPERTEQLNRAIDRAMLGGSAPVLHDSDLQGLVALAVRLRDELPRDILDPAFRDDLKLQLTRDRIESLALPQSQRAIQYGTTLARSRSRMPSFAALSVVAATLVAAVSIGLVGVLLNRDDAPSDSVAVQGTATRAISTASFGAATTTVSDSSVGTAQGGIAFLTQPVGEGDVPTAAISNTESIEPTDDATQSPDSSNPQTAVVLTATVAPQETPVRALASLPAVEVDTIEQGPTAFAEGGSDGPDDSGSVEFVLNTELPDFADSAPIYRLSPPDADPAELVAEIGARLGIEGEVVVTEYDDYREFHIDAEDGRTFRWIPETGAFQYGSLDNSVEGDLTGDAAVTALRDWLAGTGYPVEQLALSGSATPFQEGQWQVELSIASMPQPGVGHPLGVRAFVNDEGVVLSATGYWLVSQGEEEATLWSAEECWGALQSGAGYWRDGGMSSEGGELRVSSLEVSYVLTRDENGLVLQPVIQADGNFLSADGLTESPVSVFIQAARAGS